MEDILNKPIKLNDIHMKILLFFPISTVIQGINIFHPINKILIAILILMTIMLILEKCNRYGAFLSISIVCISVLGFLECENLEFGTNDLFYY